MPTLREVWSLLLPASSVHTGEWIAGAPALGLSTGPSLSLNGRIRAIVKDKIAEVSIAAIAGGALLWLVAHTAEFAYEKLLEKLVSHAESGEITRKEIEDIVHNAIEAYQKQGRKRATELFWQLERDDAIAGVGTSIRSDVKPEHIIPRSEFKRREAQASDSLFLEIDGNKRIRQSRETLTLVSPVLLEGDRRWRFIGIEGEFGAAIKDGSFLDSALRGLTSIQMVAGIKMDVDLQAIDEATHGVWEVRERNVIHVYRVIEPPIQLTLDDGSAVPPPKRQTRRNKNK